MVPQRWIAPIRWIAAAGALGAIVAIYRLWLHVNPTTVALTLLLLTLSLAVRWGLRYAVVVSIAATLCYNFFFLPPVGTWTIADPQNWIALLAFLITSVIASRLSIRIQEEAHVARRREHEVEVLFQLSRELLQTENVAELLRTVPDSIARVTNASFIALYLADGEQLYRSTSAADEALVGEHPQELMLLSRVTQLKTCDGLAVPLRTGVRPRGVLLLAPTILSDETLEALGGLVSISIDRAQALEDAARSEAAKESERLRSLMLDSITHELRTPLTAIKASATTMLSSAAVSAEDRHELLTVIDEETDRLNRLIAQAVEMAQLDTQEVHMNLLPASMEDVIHHGIHACAMQLAARPVSVNIEPRLPRVLADVTWLQKVICNLLENAAKYAPPASPIAVRAAVAGETVAVSITDRGVGIAPSEQVLIFEKFYRGRGQAHRQPGTGMGLAISRAIIESHHGTIGVSSTPGEGSTFTIGLPIWRGGSRIG
ncbi:MAG TPA: ATP-binding protein [Acidobacteriaceae bacterium]|nr:ATP-binding protein [Acidobacteriaceae bacterium]